MQRLRPSILISAVAAMSLAACTTTGGDYPRMRYASAADAGPVAFRLAGQPSSEQLRDAEDRWGRAIADSYACSVQPFAITEVGMVGALELAAMSAASRGEQSPFEGVVGYMAALARNSIDGAPRPSAERCRRLQGWVGDVRREGRTLLRNQADDLLDID